MSIKIKFKILASLLNKIIVLPRFFGFLDSIRILLFIARQLLSFGGRLEKLNVMLTNLDKGTKELVLFSLNHLKQTCSSDFQDLISLHYSLKDSKDKYYYLEIGAADGVKKSNCYMHEKHGWLGVCIEPNPALFQSLRENRTATCFQNAFSSKEDHVTLSWVDGLETGGSIDFKHSSPNAKEIKVKTISSAELKKYFPEAHIDYVSIDTEGLEDEIINDLIINFNISVISVEVNYDHEKAERINKLLSENYSVAFRYLTRNDMVFVRNDLMDE